MSISKPLKLGGAQTTKPPSAAGTWKLMADDMDDDEFADEDDLADEVQDIKDESIALPLMPIHVFGSGYVG